MLARRDLMSFIEKAGERAKEYGQYVTELRAKYDITDLEAAVDDAVV